MDPHGYGRPHSKTDYSWAGSDSQVNHNTFTDTSSIDDNQEAQFEAQFSRDHGIGGWIDPRESQPVIHPNVSSVATSHVDPEHSLPYLSSRSFKHTNEPQKPSSSNLTVGSATNSRQHDTEQIRCNWQGCAHLFATRGALKRHIEFYHIRPASFVCPHAECDKIFNRESNLGEHLRGVHHEQNGRGSHQGSNNGWNAYNAQGKGVHSSRPLETPHSLAEWRQQHHGRYPERHTENLGDLDGPIQDKHEGLIKTGGEAIQGRPSSPGLEDHCIQRFHESRLETDNAPSSEKHLGMHLQDKSIGRSMETDFTLLPKSSPYATETDKRRTGNLDHILNPTAYYKKLDTLELDTADICGLDSGPPDAHSQRDFRDGFSKVNSALKNLQTEGFCGRMMSILIEDPVQPNIARAIHICPQELDGPGSSYSTRVDEILQEICGDNGLLGDFLPGQEDSRFCFLATALLVGVVSFSGSHVCSFDVNLWRKSVSEIPVGFGFFFRRRDLACLKDFVGGPAWVLGRSREKSEGIRMKVSLTVQDLQELWGPVWLVGGTRENGPIIRTERGFVVPLPRHQQSDITGRGVECHWTKTCPLYADALNPIMLTNTSRVLIGTTFGLTVNSQCQNQIGDIQGHFANQLQLPGACNHYYITEGYEVQLIGGQYVTGGIVGKRKRIPATTLKAALISEILDPELDVTPLLKMNIGLEISPCTGNARRLSLWHTLYLSQKRQRPHKLADCKHGIGNIECIEQCWKQSLSNRSTAGVRCFDCGVANTTTAPPAATNFKNDISNNNVARSRIVSAIMALQHTGLDPEGNLQAYWPFVETRMTRRIQPSRSSKWFNIIADTRDSATFAVASYHCLELQGERSLTCRLNGYRDPLQKTCLSIRVAQQPLTMTERGIRQNLGLLTPPPEPDLADLSPGASFCVAGTQLYVKEIWHGQQNAIIACTNSKISQIVKWTGLPIFLEHLNPEVGKPVDVVIYKK